MTQVLKINPGSLHTEGSILQNTEKGHRGDIAVSVLTFYSDDPSFKSHLCGGHIGYIKAHEHYLDTIKVRWSVIGKQSVIGCKNRTFGTC